jgi:hypothetical protein
MKINISNFEIYEPLFVFEHFVSPISLISCDKKLETFLICLWR